VAIQKLFTSRANGTNGNIYVGEWGHMFYNEQTGNLRISDGVTPGGNPIALGSNRIGDIVFNGTTMSSTGTNQDVTIASNGTGNVYVVGNFITESPSGDVLIESLSNKTINFYIPVINSLDSGIDIIGNPDHTVQGPQNTGVMLHVTGQPNNASRIYNDGQAGYTAYIGRRYNGASGAPTQVLNGNIISRVGATPYTAAGWPALSTARIDFVASQDQTGSNQGSNIQFWTSAINSNSVSRSLTIDSNGITFADLTLQTTASIPLTQLGAASGVATLDSASRLTLSQIPTSLLGGVSYQGTWNANTNTPTLTNGVGTTGNEYAVTTAGTNLGYTFVAGDWVIYNGSTWQRIPVGGNGVTTFNTRTGAITLSNADVISALAAGSIQNSKLQNSTVTVNAGTGVTGGGTVSLGSAITVGIGQDVSANATPSFAGVTLTALSTTANIIPATGNTYSLGSPTVKWQALYIGPGSVYITDKTLGTNAELTVDTGVLQINGANQLQVGELKFVDNTIESTAGNVDIQIGQTADTANLLLNRNVVLATGKTLGLVDQLSPYSISTLAVIGGVLTIEGANGLQSGNIQIYNNTIQSTTGNTQLVLGNVTATSNMLVNQDTSFAKNVTVTGTFVTATGITHNATKPTLTANVVPINFKTDDLILVHTTGPGTTLTANLINLSTTVGKTVEVLVMSSAGGSTQFNHGVASSQSTNANSFFVTSRQSMYVKYFNIDGTTGNLFVTAIGNNTI
jgi:hypothetical protein